MSQVSTKLATLSALILASNLLLIGQVESGKSAIGSLSSPEIGHGTLVVAIASPKFIVVAADSRKSWFDGSRPPEDNSKKLFRVGKKRVLAIAGVATAVLEVPGLAEEIAPLLEDGIDRFAGSNYAAIDDRNWNDPPPPDIPEQLRQNPVSMRHLDDVPYEWWTTVYGPTQTIVNIAATYHPGLPLNNYALEGLVAGFKKNGEAKIERLAMVPSWSTSGSGLPIIGLSQSRQRFTTKDKLISCTMGITRWADWVLSGEINDSLRALTSNYAEIRKFLVRREKGTVDQASENEIMRLCKELIKLTAEETQYVGSTPVQLAIIRPKENVEMDQPTFPKPAVYLSPYGTWRLGAVLTGEFRFVDEYPGTVYVWCQIKTPKSPIQLDDNYFYGNQIESATFVYQGGNLHFGTNNRVSDSKLIITEGANESELAPVIKLFSRVEHLSKHQ